MAAARLGKGLLILLILFAACFTLSAQTLRVGLATEHEALDPQFSTTGATQQASQQIFETIVNRDSSLQTKPGLAVSWKMIDDLTWEIKLRRGVKFHDNSDFNADDIVFTLARIPKVSDSASSYKRNIAAIKETVVVDPYTVRFLLSKPSPQLPIDLSFIYVISNTIPADAITDDFNKGKTAIGTGPYKLVEWVRGDRFVVERFDSYWGVKPAFEKVVFKPILNDPSRVAALLAGDVDIIAQVPPVDIARLRKDSKISIWEKASTRMMYVHMDTERDVTPFVFAKDGSKLTKNPLKDLRVRKAISLAINRDVLTEKVLFGAGEPTGQFVSEGMTGYIPDVKPDPYDPAKAKKLLAEAGYPDGFSMTIHSTNDRYLNDDQVAQAVAQFLARVGIDMKVQALPGNVFFTQATKREYSFFQLGFGNTTGDAARGLTAVLASVDKAAGMGANNRGGYSNPEFDRLIKEASVTSDEKKREELLQKATRIAIVEDQGIIPLYYQRNLWATQKNFKYLPRTDEYTIAADVSQVR